MNRLNLLTKFATAHGITLTHPSEIADLIERRTAANALRPKAAPKLEDVLVELPIDKWDKAIRDRAQTEAVRDVKSSLWKLLPAKLEKAIDGLVVQHLDSYLAQLDTVLTDAETRLVAGAQHLTTQQLDPQVAVRNRVGDRLTDFDLGLTVVTTYAALLRQVIPRHTDSGPTIDAAAYALPPTLEPERRTVIDQSRSQKTLTSPAELDRIKSVRRTLDALSSTQHRRTTMHAIANDRSYDIRCARSRAEFHQATDAWKTAHRVEIVERASEDRYIPPSWGTVNA